jgi:subtilisin family serine protease
MRTLLLVLLLAAATPRPVAAATPPAARAYWVHFADRDLPTAAAEDAAIADAAARLTPRALERRRRVRPDSPVTLLDTPVPARYVDAVLATGVALRHRLRWFNAVTVNATDVQVAAIRSLPFVSLVKPVATQRHDFPEVDGAQTLPRHDPPDRSSLNYGECASQILPIQVDQLHDLGLSGAGVRVAIFDTGFQRMHTSLTGLDVRGEWDFVQGDGVTSNQAGDDPGQHNHGTLTLSILAGYDPGNLIGPAYGAELLLAKTEDVSSETPAEEDNWAAAAQWADSLGADVITSSLVYTDWYSYSDLDGNTATITIAADLAAANGITVFNSAGNYGNGSWFYIGPPADGNEVIAVGAVDSLDVISGYSSHGPTFDGRTKPDVCAMGTGTLFALASDNNGYSRGTGTSLSCPLTAGVGALLLEAHPGWTPSEIREALRETATQPGSPDNDYGWGVIRAYDAYGYGVTAAPAVAIGPGAALRVSPNPSATVSRIRWSAAELARSLDVVDVAGRRLRTFDLSRGGAAAEGTVGWDGLDESGRAVPAGIYFARLTTASGVRTARVVRLR